MAENESLDLANPGGQRWNRFHDAVQKAMPLEKVAQIAKECRIRGLRKALKELAKCDAPFEQLLRARHDQKLLGGLVRKSRGHEYAHLFAETAAAERDNSDQELVLSYLNAIDDQIDDQVVRTCIEPGSWQSIPSIRDYLRDIRKHLEADLRSIANKLADDPTWVPRFCGKKKFEKSEATQQLLSVSLLGMTKK